MRLTISPPKYVSSGGAVGDNVPNTSPANAATRSLRGACVSGRQSSGKPPIPPIPRRKATRVAFRRGIGGNGGLPEDCRPETQAPRKLRVAALAGLVFGTLSPTAPPLETYLGGEIVKRIRRVMRAPVRVLGSYSQIVRSNWK